MNPKLTQRAFAALALLGGGDAVYALTPWTDGDPTYSFYISGGAAQDQALNAAIESLAAPGTTHIFGDHPTNPTTTPSSANTGARWTVYYFNGKSTLGGNLSNAKIAVVKRSLGAAGYGVIPLFSPPNGGQGLEELHIAGLAAPGTGNTEVFDEPGKGPNWYRVVVGSSTTRLGYERSHGGIAGIDAKLLLKPGTHNYPAPVAKVATANGAPAVDANWSTTFSSVPPSFSNLLPTGGLVYGVPVTTDLYRVLQAAQYLSGTLPADTVTGGHLNDYALAAGVDENYIPTLSRNFVGSLISGKINTWDQVRITVAPTVVGVVGATPGASLKLTDIPGIFAANGWGAIALPPTTANPAFVGQRPVAVSNRNSGAAIGAVGYAYFLNYPWTAGASEPLKTASPVDATAAPIVKLPGGTAGTGNLLNDWQVGANASGLNPTSARRWGIGLNSADRNGSLAQGFRYVRLEGAAPTIENVAAGRYPLWGEGGVFYDKTLYGDANTVPQTDTFIVLNAIATELRTPASAGVINNSLVQPWGRTGIFGLTKYGAAQSIPFNEALPVVGYTYNQGTILNEVVPTFFNAAGGVLLK